MYHVDAHAAKNRITDHEYIRRIFLSRYFRYSALVILRLGFSGAASLCPASEFSGRSGGLASSADGCSFGSTRILLPCEMAYLAESEKEGLSCCVSGRILESRPVWGNTTFATSMLSHLPVSCSLKNERVTGRYARQSVDFRRLATAAAPEQV